MSRINKYSQMAVLAFFTVLSLTGCNLVLRKISGTLPTNGDVSESVTFRLSPDGLWAIYIADPFTDEKFELFITAIHGRSNPRRLTPASSLAPTITGFAFSPDSARVVYTAAQDDASKVELYSVPVAGGTPIKLNAALAGPRVENFEVYPSLPGAVIYKADQDTLNQIELYSVSLDGTNRRKLNDTLPAASDVRFFQLAKNNDRVVFLVGDSPTVYHDLYSVWISGNGRVKLNGDPTESCNVKDFKISANGSYVVYKADQDIDGVDELYAVPTNGSSAPVKLNPDLPNGRSVSQFNISNNWVGYVADQDTNNVMELYVVPITGGASLKINDTLPVGGEVSTFEFYLLTGYIAYLADQESIGRFEVFTVDFRDIPLVRDKLNETPVLDGDVFSPFKISPDGHNVVFRGDLETNGVSELYVSTDGSSMKKLSGSLVSGGNVGYFEISPDNRFVAYKADKLSDEVFEVFGVAMDGSLSKNPINGPMTAESDVDWFFFNENSDALIYSADQDVDEKWELYSFFDENLLYLPAIMH